MRSLTSAIILKVTYGYTVDSSTPDPLVKLIEQWISNFSQATVPFSFLVDIFPVLKHLPDWAPGAGFKKIGRAWAKNNSAAGNIPYLFAKERVESGSFTPSYVSTALQQNLVDDSRSEVSASEYEEQIIWTAANLYAGGSDTTVSSVHSFLLAMVLNPEVQRKAQDDIANVVGTDRLPCFEDRKSLPFIDALVTEIHRWFPVGPMGLPHRADEAVVYNSYQIPKGAYILPAVWSVLHDPETYSNPHEFDPSRYLEPRAEPDPRIFSFGAGRRICPGRFFADNTIFLTVAGILAVCTIRKAVDSQGNEVEVALQPTPGTVSKPTPFLYKIETRNPKLSELVRNLEVEQSSRGDIVGLMEKFGVS
ncbi:hypothetical protein NQ176_g7488 [Zarea fungicola]|uniref:Uncharacterized protein n=1 Tax=Zarea fungicola TaxID=93591 RepID=A0ACC1MXX5_9HYPO|nr:hypothetical protein NQ176_g7488 [Lecanicillium fungicola]